MLPKTPRCLLTEAKNWAHLVCLPLYNKQARLTLGLKHFYNKLRLWHVVARSMPILKASLLKNLFPDLSFTVCTTYHQSEQRVGVCSFSPFTRGTIITTYECVWMEHKCLLFGSTVQSQFNPGNDIGLPFSFSVCQNRFSVRGCRL